MCSYFLSDKNIRKFTLKDKSLATKFSANNEKVELLVTTPASPHWMTVVFTLSPSRMMNGFSGGIITFHFSRATKLLLNEREEDEEEEEE